MRIFASGTGLPPFMTSLQAMRTGLGAMLSRPRAIRSSLMRMVFILVIPVWLGFALVVYGFYTHERDNIAHNTIATARALTSAVDRDLIGTTVAAQILAQSPLLQSGDFEGFHRLASTVIPLVFGNNFVLAVRSGQQLLNTLRPFGSPLPIHGTPENQRLVFETGQPVISNLFIGRVSGKPVVTLDVPVFVQGEVKYTLSVGLLPERLTALLLRQKLPPDWITVILDASGTIVARTHAADQYIGKKGSARTWAAIGKSDAGVVRSTTVDGVAVYSAFSRSSVSNWTVAIGIPVSELSSRLNAYLLIGGGVALCIMLIGLAAAAYQSSHIARAVQALIPPALALGRGEVPQIPQLRVKEANDVADALTSASQFIQARTTERDQAERKEEQAQVVARMMDEFVATVSHELRTPLTSIAGSLGLLTGGVAGKLPDKALRLVSIAHSNALRLVRLINDILDIGKIESGHMTFHFEPVDLHDAVNQSIEANVPFAQGHGVTIRLGLASKECVVRADPDRLIQVVTNLLSNAIKFSPKGAEVLVTIERRGDMGQVLVRDRGPGIPEEFKPHVFEKFAQAETGSTRQKGGSGLGLNIVANIVAQHGGTVGFKEPITGGTTFHIEIPLWNDKSVAPARDPGDGAEVATSAGGNNGDKTF
jgi:signal transduction histidine kinase